MELQVISGINGTIICSKIPFADNQVGELPEIRAQHKKNPREFHS
jgi:hypothetical protein